ncbi:MAG: BON domain-containing protein [Legionella sp.]|nr:BON domain-containing protein [Legionella sp.]
MNKQGCYLLFFLLSLPLLNGCLSNVWTGASLVYNRHNVYKKFDDYKLALTAHNLLFNDALLKEKGCILDIAAFNGDLLVAGHVPTEARRALLTQRLKGLSGHRELFIQVAVAKTLNSELEDAWITTKIRSQMIADAAIDPGMFKIITSDRVVYVMGDVKPEQATRVLNIARNSNGVLRVVKLLRYYNLSETPDNAS